MAKQKHDIGHQKRRKNARRREELKLKHSMRKSYANSGYTNANRPDKSHQTD